MLSFLPYADQKLALGDIKRGEIDELSKVQRIDDRRTATGTRTRIRRASMHQLRVGFGSFDTTKPAQQPTKERLVHAGRLSLEV